MKMDQLPRLLSMLLHDRVIATVILARDSLCTQRVTVQLKTGVLRMAVHVKPLVLRCLLCQHLELLPEEGVE